MNVKDVGSGKVVLIAGGERIYTDIAARFVRSERELEDIIGSAYDKRIVGNILSSGHGAATEFDYFLFGVAGYSRIVEIQLVRKRIASYLIKSGRQELNGKRKFDVVVPNSIKKHTINYGGLEFDCYEIFNLIEQWYEEGVHKNLPEEDLRYIKPQATTFKAIIGMNCRALIDYFKIRCCFNCQTEHHDMAIKMLRLCKQAAPDLFKKAGANCVSLGYCPENKFQNIRCRGKIPTHDEVIKLINDNKKEIK